MCHRCHVYAQGHQGMSFDVIFMNDICWCPQTTFPLCWSLITTHSINITVNIDIEICTSLILIYNISIILLISVLISIFVVLV